MKGFILLGAICGWKDEVVGDREREQEREREGGRDREREERGKNEQKFDNEVENISVRLRRIRGVSFYICHHPSVYQSLFIPL